MEEVVEEGDWVQSMEITQIGWLEGLVGRKRMERPEVEASGLRHAILHLLLLLLWRFGVVVVMAVPV